MEPLTFGLAVVGITEFVKRALQEWAGFKVQGATTLAIGIIVSAVLNFVDLNSGIVQNVYMGITAIGGLVAAQKISEKIG